MNGACACIYFGHGGFQLDISDPNTRILAREPSHQGAQASATFVFDRAVARVYRVAYGSCSIDFLLCALLLFSGLVKVPCPCVWASYSCHQNPPPRIVPPTSSPHRY